MTITGAIVLFAVIWFLTLFVALPIGLRTQDEAGDIEPGTPASAPSQAFLRRKFFWVTIVTVILWAPLCIVIASGVISMRDIDFWGRM